ncbi:MAG: hypothetical protein ACN6QT_29840 [Burkholderia contaminans]|uniref:Uncharacterized protein n=1 Tax=Burkholderia contaminans TaxID=488447 RepID=A0AAP4R7B6_9BURK|nr:MULTISPECIES: hypothetical protein [Burkholderia]MBD1409815.1 hypothetical protein [Burkholderia contaminans]MBH9671822.1 hypothetical protein [Burkholderia contaminans]MBH9679234.1 hypothetical protein [Burkholderia contaminans]MBH9709231.1 hypothetical protein [Burkholderia contaminans]MBM6425054.1 hypothetical protein [Burkholderia contaminans]
MAGADTVAVPKVLTQTDSTPMEQQDGHPVAVELVRLVEYTVNIRSFHPNKKFERLGFRFHGDTRGFSLEESFHPSYLARQTGKVTSRVWQLYSCNLAAGSKDKFQDRLRRSKYAGSNTSSGPWWASDGPEPYTEKKYQPDGTADANAFEQGHAGEQIAEVTSWYGGKNFAFLGSRLDWNTLHTTVVPTLDARGHLWIRVERVRRWMDICMLVYGDGFPNCESFIEDPAGNKLFLGTHVRIGTPATHLAGDNKRIMFANVLRVELTLDGNFGSKLWIFTQALGGTPDRRDDYPAIRDIKTAPGTPTRRMSDPDPSGWSGVPGDGPPVILPGMDVVAWPADPLSKIGDGVSGGLGAPLHISAYEEVGAVWQRLQDSFKRPPATRDTTVQAWNDYHLHRNPNEGRAPDSEDLDPKLWKK